MWFYILMLTAFVVVIGTAAWARHYLSDDGWFKDSGTHKLK